MIPFSFKIPQYVPVPDAINEQLLRLPPSVNEEEATIDVYGRPCMQPLIQYTVRSFATIPALSSSDRIQLQQSRMFVLIPFTGIAPPLEQADFPGEFKPSSVTVLRKPPFAAPIGELSVAMGEPEALKVLSEGGKCCAKAWVKLRFRPSRMKACRERWECTLESQIRVKTFYSTMPLDGMASNHLLSANRHLRVRSKFIGLESRKANLNLLDFTKEASNEDLQPSGHFTYSSELLLPVDVAENLLPTFCSPLAARRYALMVSLSIKRLSHEPMVVEAPLQVCYCSGAGNQTHNEGREYENTSRSTAPSESIRSSVIDEGGTIEVSTSLIRPLNDAQNLTI
jgi:hypothetical protein